MFTNQWNMWLSAGFTVSSSTKYVASGTCKNINGVEIANYRYAGSKIDEYSVSSGEVNRGFIFGTGTAAPQKTDYCLENPCGSDIVQDGQSNSYGLNADGKFTYTKVVSLRNDGSSSVTISEVGLKTLVEGTSSNYCLVWRDVLSSPVTLGPGDTKNIEVVIEFPN